MRTLQRGFSRAAGFLMVALGSAAIALTPVCATLQAQTPTPAQSTSPSTAPGEAPAPVRQPDPYPASLDFGTGLIDIPVAWVSPNSSDFWLSYGAKRIPSQPVIKGGAFSYWNGNVALDTHWLNRFDVGAALYSNNPEWGFFGQVLLVRDGEFWSFLPAIAAGVRNVGPDTHEERFLIGTDVTVDSLGHQHETVPFYFKEFHTAPTFYGVATKSITFHSAALSSISFTIGGGDGLFSQDGDLGAEYNKSGTVVRGMFFGARTVSHPSTNTTISLVGENNGFDYNAGIVGGWRGLSIGVYGSELEAGSARSASSLNIYNYTKWNVSFSYSGNFREVGHGHWLRTQITQLQREQQLLRADIAQRERTIKELQVRLAKLQQGELGDAAKQRELLEQQLEQERQAIQRANDRLKQLQGEKPQ
jgi:hypothetical protein